MSAEEFKAIYHTQTSLGRRRLEAIVTRHQARPRILEAGMVPDILGRCNWALNLFVPLSRRGCFCSNLVRTTYRLVDGGNLAPSIIHFR